MSRNHSKKVEVFRTIEASGLMRSPRFGIVFTSVLLAFGRCVAQNAPELPRDTIARVGTEGITSSQLLRRLELMPFPDQTKKVDSDTIKARALRSMIAEKVLANEQLRLGYQENRGVALMHNELENALIRDALYRRHIVDSIRTTPSEIEEGLARIVHVIKALAFLVRNEEEAQELARFLRNATPDSVGQRVPRSLYATCDTLSIKFGAPDTAIERAAFEIGTSRVSFPVCSAEFGWVVLYLLDRAMNREAATVDLPDRSRRVEKIVRARHESVLYTQYYTEILKRHHASGDSTTFNILADSIAALWNEDTTHFQSKGYYILTGDVVDLLVQRLEPYLDRTLVTLEDGTLTLARVLEMFRYKDFQSKAREGTAFKIELNEAIRNLIGNELIAREGRKENLHYDPAVRNDLNIWTDYWAAREAYYRVRNSVSISDDEILTHLLNNVSIFGKYFEVNIREILCKNLNSMDEATSEMGRGRSFADVAGQYTARSAWKGRGGESGYFEVSLHPELGFLAMNTDTGKVAGPVKLPEGYSLFKVLGKRMTTKAVTNFEMLKRNTRARLLSEKQKKTVDKYIADLVKNQHVTIDYAKLKRLSYNRVQLFTRRLIGFGGRMSAAPMLMKQWDWIKEYQPPEEVMP